MYYFLQRYQRSGKNVKCKLRKRYARGEAAVTIFRPLALGNSNSDWQPRPNSGAHSIIFDTCALFCLVFDISSREGLLAAVLGWLQTE